MDLEVVETGNGGDLVKNTKDLSVINGFQNMIYLGLFGGNVEASTSLVRVANEQAFDWWGNNLFFPNDASVQMNSETERTLNNVALNSSGCVLIERAVDKDLEFMNDFADVTREVTILSTDKVKIEIKAVRLDNLQERVFIFIWDATDKELIEQD